jgi:hypothetical protein
VNEYDDFVRERLAAGDDPNVITSRILDGLHEHAHDWGLSGTGKWYPDKVCATCGSSVPGICGHEGDPNRRIILRREYAAASAVPPPPQERT